ncbi:MAG: SGNH/GDSL hydrolase family protein [Lachnospiraceae bacterium]
MKNFLFLGDSITDCFHSFDKDNLGRGYVRMIAEDLGHFNGHVLVRNMGTDGFTVPAVRRLWQRSCLSMQPDFLTILIGVNDLSLIENGFTVSETALKKLRQDYEALIEDIRATTDCPILFMEPFIFPHPAEYALWMPDLRKISSIIQETVKAHDLAFLPLWDRLLQAADADGYDAVTTDGIHLTPVGHRIIADAWKRFMLLRNDR